MDQHPRVTLEWALYCLEVALRNLEDGPAERRVRRQFHQVLLAVERDARSDQTAQVAATETKAPPEAAAPRRRAASTRARPRAGA